MMKWSEYRKSHPFFWMWLTAWLKSKGADSIQVKRGLSNTEYVKVRFNIPIQEQDLTEAMLSDLFDEAGIRICIDFDTEGKEANWRYVIHRKGLSDFWTQAHSSQYAYKERKYAVWNGMDHAINEINESLKKQNAVAYH